MWLTAWQLLPTLWGLAQAQGGLEQALAEERERWWNAGHTQVQLWDHSWLTPRLVCGMRFMRVPPKSSIEGGVFLPLAGMGMGAEEILAAVNTSGTVPKLNSPEKLIVWTFDGTEFQERALAFYAGGKPPMEDVWLLALMLAVPASKHNNVMSGSDMLELQCSAMVLLASYMYAEYMTLLVPPAVLLKYFQHTWEVHSREGAPESATEMLSHFSSFEPLNTAMNQFQRILQARRQAFSCAVLGERTCPNDLGKDASIIRPLVDVVIVRCREDVSWAFDWIGRVLRDEWTPEVAGLELRLLVYEKCFSPGDSEEEAMTGQQLIDRLLDLGVLHPGSDAIYLAEPQGFENVAYVHYCMSPKWRDSDFVIFLHGYPFDHTNEKMLDDVLRSMAQGTYAVPFVHLNIKRLPRIAVEPCLQELIRPALEAWHADHQVLGTGYSGAVCLAEHRSSKRQVAVKQFRKRRLKEHRLKMLKSEVEVYLRLDHPNICRLLHAYEGRRYVWLVMEICSCELYSRLCERKVYCEEDAADVMRQMLQAINYLRLGTPQHSHNIVHRDLKLENWMYGAPTCQDQDRIKLIDFGFSEIIQEDTKMEMPCGTLHYTSPEVLSRNYTKKCDLWSCGVICYMLLIGRPPFRGANNARIARAILEGDFPKEGRWEFLSSHAQDFVMRLLQRDVGKRMSASAALEHPWLKGGGCTPSPVIGVSVLQSLRTFAQTSHLRRATLTILAYSLTSTELEGLEQTFLDFDQTGRGTVTLEQLRDAMQTRLDVSSAEVNRIFQAVDFTQNDEIQYTPFVAALLATRVKLHQDKVREAFDAFDIEGKGCITAETLVQVFNSQLCEGGAQSCISKEEAEEWVREVDFKGNGVIDYPSFLAAMMGRSSKGLPSSEDLADQPSIRVFEESPSGRPRGLTESFTAASCTLRLRDAILDTCDTDSAQSEKREGRGRAKSCNGLEECSEKVQIRFLACPVDEHYF
ncbi:CPK2 [Symbiodinium necroappetens]|uniref:CPK2 protein n=1 Tax=Symbiodinium necroappetens TaxID=1628268 RepID=A0A812Z8X4_9DINO|nr:CPK2 [Symbiodinium necroappetens]